MKSYKILLTFLFLIPALSSCSSWFGPSYHYEFTAPTSKHGKKCVTQCMEISEHCEESCSWQEQSCKDRVARGDKDDKFVDDLGCSFKKSDCNNRCSRNYRRCYRDCGGAVIEVKDKA